MRQVVRNMFRLLAVVVGCTALSVAAFAQSTTDGAIGGMVTDQSKAVVVGATVTVRNPATNVQETTTTDEQGRFRVVRLNPGTYAVSVEAANFSPMTQPQVVVEVGRVTSLELQLSIAGKQETVEIQAELPIINTLQQDFNSNINQTSISELPTNGRRWSDFVLLTPGASPDGNFGLISFRGISGLLNNSTVDGGDNNNAFYAEERGRTRIQYAISQAAIREFQVNTSNFSAEYGRAAGGVVNAVTKSGTNKLHGEGWYYIRDNELGARNPFSFVSQVVNGVLTPVPLKPEDRRHQFGANLGGPIIKDKLFFFFNWDQQKRNFPGVAVFGDPRFADPRTVTGLTQAQVDAGLAFLRSVTGVVPRKGDQLTLLPKIDWVVSSNHTFSATYNRLRWDSPAGIQTQATVQRGIASFGDDYVDGDSVTARLSSALTPNVSNEFRFQYSRDNLYALSPPPSAAEKPFATGIGGRVPSVDVAGSSTGITFGKPDFLERKANPDETRYQFSNNTTWARGNHLLKAGADINYVNDVLDNLRNEGGAYTYSTLTDFLTDFANPSAKRYSGFNQAFGPTAFEFKTVDYNAYVQDEWHVIPRLTLNLGLRYEYQVFPEPQVPNPDYFRTSVFPQSGTGGRRWYKGGWGPRFGFALDVFGDSKTALRGGYGIYHGRVINSTISNAITNTGAVDSQRSFFIRFSDAGSPTFPNVLSAAPTASVTPDIVVFADRIRNPKIHQADLVLEREIMRNTVLSASYLVSLGRNLPYFVDINLNPPTATRTLTVVGGELNGKTVTVPVFLGARPNTKFGRITEVRSSVQSRYDALVVQLNRRFTKGLQFQTNYTWSHATDDGQDSVTFTRGNSPLNPYDLAGEYGNSNFDVRHKFVTSIVWSPEVLKGGNTVARAILNGYTISPIVTLSSGRPFTATTSGSLPLATGVSSPSSGVLRSGGSTRVPFLARNTYHFPHLKNVNLRLSRRFKFGEGRNLEVLGETFNLFNRTQVTDLNTRLYTVGGTASAPTLTFDNKFWVATQAGATVVRERQVQFAARFAF